MKASNQFILRTIADEHLLIPVGESAISVKGLIALSESGLLLYKKLMDGCSREDLIAALTAEYEVSEEEAAQDTDAFLNQMRQLNMLVDD
ncbi:MAG: PqqD family protein [Clostridia bacterium]|nr:PqqD family protein [Clostridia bacterium]